MSDKIDFSDLVFTSIEGADLKKERRTSRCIVVIAFGDGQCLLAEPSVALDMAKDGGSVGPLGEFILSDCGVSCSGEGNEDDPPGLYVGELRIVDGGPESWEMPHIRDYYPEIHKLRPITKEEWKSHCSGEWPEGWNEKEEANG